jgi:hypothetical protein
MIKMNSKIKSILRIIFFFLIGIILAGVLIPFVYKDKIVQYLKQATNKNINATVDFKDADISVFSSFPSLRITIDSLSVVGQDTFDGIVLYASPETAVDLNLASLFGKNKTPEINKLYAYRPEINIVILDSLRVNYLIQNQKEPQTASQYKLTLKSYEIKEGKLTYQDNTLNLFMALDNCNHKGKGDFTQDVFDLFTETNAEKVHVRFDGTEYLNGAKANLIADLNLNFPENKYTLINNSLQINDFDVQADGFFQIKNEGIYNDITFKTASESFKSFLSLVPGAYTKDFSNVKASGNASLSGFVKGIYNSEKSTFPAFDIQCVIKNGSAKYPDLPQELKNIQADINIKSSKPNLSDFSFAVPMIKLNIGNDPIEGKLLVTRVTSDQNVTGYLKAKLNLANIKNAFPIENLEKLAGQLHCNLDFKAKMEDITAKNYNKISFSGEGSVSSIVYQSVGMPVVTIGTGKMTASPEILQASAQNIKMGKSDADVSLKIHNPLSLFTLDDKINADFSINSGFLDLNEWMQHPDKAPESKSTTAPVTIDDRIIQNSGLNLNIKAGKILFNDKTIENININGTMAANAIQINELSAKIQKSDIRLKGKVINVYDYLFNNNILDGELELNSDYFDANQFLVNTPSGGTENTSAIPVPDRVRIQLHTQIKELLYTNLQLKDFQGILEVKNKEVAIKNVETNALGGKMYFDGLYNTTDLSQPDFAVKLDLSKIAFAEAISKIDMFKKVAPIAAYINGFFNTSIVMRGKLGGTMMPDLSTLDASGMIETLNGAIKGSNPMAELAQKTGIKELSEIDLANSKNWFEIIKGFMELKPYTTKIKGVNFTISGKHGFGKEMDYKINLVIPREILKKNKILGVAEAGLSNIEKEAGKLGINIQQGPEVFLDVLMTGPFKKPNFKIIPRNSQGSTYTDAVESKAKDIVKNVTDSVKSEIKKKETELRDTITKRANEELEKVKSQVEKTADKAIDSIKAVAKDQVISRLDTLTKGVISDSLKQKAKDILDKKSNEEVDKIKEKLKDFNPFKKKKEGGG